MTIRTIEIRRAYIELVAPFQTSFGVETDRNLLYVRVIGDEAEGWGECVAMTDPLYSSEYVDGCEDVLRRYLIPCVKPDSTLESVLGSLTQFRGNYMAKATLEAALLDYFTRLEGVSLATFLGATQSRVASGVSVGIQPSIDALLNVVAGYVADGYVRIKLKIEPGRDIEPVRASLARLGLDTPGQLKAAQQKQLVAVLGKAEASHDGKIRGYRHTMLDDSDISSTRHARGFVCGALAGLVGHAEIYVSGGAEHQGPDGGGPVALIAEQNR